MALIQAPPEAPGPTLPFRGSRIDWGRHRGAWAARLGGRGTGTEGKEEVRVCRAVLPMAAEASGQDYAVVWGLCEATSGPRNSPANPGLALAVCVRGCEAWGAGHVQPGARHAHSPVATPSSSFTFSLCGQGSALTWHAGQSTSPNSHVGKQTRLGLSEEVEPRRKRHVAQVKVCVLCVALWVLEKPGWGLKVGPTSEGWGSAQGPSWKGLSWLQTLKGQVVAGAGRREAQGPGKAAPSQEWGGRTRAERNFHQSVWPLARG